MKEYEGFSKQDLFDRLDALETEWENLANRQVEIEGEMRLIRYKLLEESKE